VGAGDGGKAGLPAVYAQIVQQEVRKKWRYPAIGTQSIPAATVWVRIDKRGKIVDKRLVKSSGKSDYDASVLRALEDVTSLPEQPLDNLEITINFNIGELRK
jgi:TonB family protein